MKIATFLTGCISSALAAPIDSLPPLVVTGNKLATASERQTGQYTLLEAERFETVSAISGTYQDLFALVAGGYSGNPTAGSFSLRGLNQDNVFGYVGTGSNSLIAVLEDGAPLSSATLRFLPPVLWNIDHAEVLRGPQSLSHGPNSLGGALLFQTTLPGFSRAGNAMAELAQHSTYRAAINQDFTLLLDELALRFSYLHQESEGEATNRFFDDDEFGATERDRFQARLLWYPGKSRDSRFDLSLVHDRSAGNPFATVTSSPGVEFFDRENSLNTQSSYPTRRSAATFNATFVLPAGLELKSTTSAQFLDVDQAFDLDATPFLEWFVDGVTKENRFTEDLVLARRTGTFQWLLGGYLEFSEYEVGFSGFGISPFPFGSPFANDVAEDVRIAALYGRFDWEFAENFHTTGGLRLNHEERDLRSTAQLGALPQVRSAAETSATDLLPQLGVSWQPNASSTTGFQVTRGYRGGGVAYAPTLGTSQPYDPEYAWEMELYSRLAPTEDLTLSVAVFYSRLEDQQVPINVPGGLAGVDTLIANAASSRRYGAELEASWRAHETLVFHAATGLTKTEFTGLTLEGVDRSGQSFPNSPEWTASLGAVYRHPTGFFSSLLFAYAESTYSFAGSPTVTALESRELLSARIGWAWSRASVFLFGSNLLNDEYALLRADNSATNRPVSGKAAPARLLGIGCEARW